MLKVVSVCLNNYVFCFNINLVFLCNIGILNLEFIKSKIYVVMCEEI